MFRGLFGKSNLIEIELIQLDLFEIKLFQMDSYTNKLFGMSHLIRKSKPVIK